ncbi:MAG TPA: DNA polymerase III subunit delta [Gemmatimonadaceae bacterium]|nr:DNA polymerase III subunit delta [Gemmatimonadaceae bacterium]
MSSPSGQKLVRAAIQARQFAPAYLFYGEDDFLKEDLVRQVLESALEGAPRDFNLEVCRGGEVDPETLASVLASPPMMADRRAVVIRDALSLKKDARKVLDDYLRRPAPDTLVLLVAPAGAKLDKHLGDSVVAVEFEPLAGGRVPGWIAYHTEHVLHTRITPDAATLLQDAIGSDLSHLSIELEKLANYCAGNPIDAAAVSTLVGVQAGGTLGDLLDAIAKRDARAALTLLPQVLSQPKASPVTIVMALTTQTLAIAWARARRDRGARAAGQSGELFALLKEAGSAYTGRSWGDAVASWSEAVDRWTLDELGDALGVLLAADQSLKDSRMSSDDQRMSGLILDLCALRRRQRVA